MNNNKINKNEHENKDVNKKEHKTLSKNPTQDDKPVIEGSGATITTYSMMDKHNKKAADDMASKGMDAAVEYMFKHPETGQSMDYATMRHFYG